MRKRNRVVINLSAYMAMILSCVLMASCGLPYKASKVAKEATKLYETLRSRRGEVQGCTGGEPG
jgi:hypothetical protein